VSLVRSTIALILLSACAGCAGGGRHAAHWDGRRGYDGHGDYGYDLAASQAEASRYRARAARNYPVPGTPDDPWGPYIREAASRFQVPEQWIREVMRQESGGRLYDDDGGPITSSAGAMGLMQVMPHTYEMLRQRYGLGDDPYEPHNNILAGAAYIREMYERYGSPGFLAAYNAGPDRLDAYLAGSTALPDETISYVANVAPRLGNGTAAGGVFPAVAQAEATDADRAYAGGGMAGQEYYAQNRTASIADDPSLRAFDGGGLVTPDAPTGVFTGRGSALGRASVSQPSPIIPVAATAAAFGGGWSVQVGAYPDPATSQAALAMARAHAGSLLDGTQPAITPVQHGGLLYRARFVGLSASNATATCARLTSAGMDCFAVPPGS
jgi:hypothetical protein